MSKTSLIFSSKCTQLHTRDGRLLVMLGTLSRRVWMIEAAQKPMYRHCLCHCPIEAQVYRASTSDPTSSYRRRAIWRVASKVFHGFSLKVHPRIIHERTENSAGDAAFYCNLVSVGRSAHSVSSDHWVDRPDINALLQELIARHQSHDRLNSIAGLDARQQLNGCPE